MNNHPTVPHPVLVPLSLRAGLAAVLMALASLLFGATALATSAPWSGSTSALWSDTNNWVGLPVTPPGSNELATFNATSANTTLDLTGGLTISSNLFDTVNAAAYTIGAGGAGAQTLTNAAPGAITVTATVTNNQLFNANLRLGTTAGAKVLAIANNSATATLTLAGISTTQLGTNTITFTGGGTTIINGTISNNLTATGAVALVKGLTGGVLVLAASNNFTWVTNYTAVTFSGGVNAADNGAVRITHSDALTGATIAMPGQNATTQTIELANNVTVTNRINSNSRDVGRPMIRNVSGTNNFAGLYVATATGGGVTFEANSGKLNMTGGFITTNSVSARALQLQGTGHGEISYPLLSTFVGAFTKTGTGTWTLSASNAMPSIGLSGGTLVSAHPNSLGTGLITITGAPTLNLATDGADFTNALTAGSGITFGLSSDVKTGSAGINHTLGSITLGSGAPALQMNITRGPNVLSGNPRITTPIVLLTGGSGGTTIINPTTADFTAGSVTATTTAKTLQLDGTSTGNQITGVISNVGANFITLVKSGSGTWTLSGANTYSGSTTVSNGTLAVTGSGTIPSTNITVVSGGTLDVSGVSFTLGAAQILGGSGTVNGNVTTTAGSQLLPAGVSSVGKLTFNNTLSLVGGETVKFDFAAGTNDTVAVGTLTPSGVTTVNIASLPPGGLASGTYTLFTANTLNGLASNFAVSGAPSPSRQTFTITYDTVSSPKRVLLTVAGSAANLLWTGVAPAWDINTAFNWTNTLAGTNDVFLDGDNVNFTDLGTAISPVLNVTVQPSSATFSAAGNYTLSGTGKIGGGGSFTKSGAGTVTLLTTNDYTGSSALNGGIVSVDNVANGGVASALGAASSAPANLAFNGGVLEFTGAAGSTDRGATLNGGGGTVAVTNAAATLTVSGAIAGTGALTKAGEGILALGGANSYGGATVVNAGTLTANGGNAVPNTSAVSLADVTGVALNLGASETVGSLTGGGLNGGNVTLNANTLTVGANNASSTYAGNISGTGGLTKTGTGAFTLTAANSFSGNLFVKAGTLIMDNGSATGMTLWNSIGQDGTDNGTLNLTNSGALTTTGDFNVGDIGSSVGTLNISDNASLNVNAFYIGSANAAGSTASGTVNQTGGTVIENNTGVGTFAIGGRLAATGSGVYNISGGSLTAAAGIRVGGAGTGTLNISGTANVTANGGINIARLAGSTGTANLNGGTFTTLNIASSTGVNATNNFNGATVRPTVANATFCQGLTRANVRNGGFLLDDLSFNLTINQALLHSDIAGDNAIDGGLNKSGSGTLTLTAANTYTGPTVINAGTLLLTGSLGTGAVTNFLGSTLTGNGTLAGATDIQGAITPGNTVGVLTVSNSLKFESGATANFNFISGSNSTITATGAFTVAGPTTINLNFIGTVPPIGTNTLIRYGSHTGGVTDLNIATTNPRYTFSLYDDTVAQAIKLVVAGNPQPLVWRGDGANNFWDNLGTSQVWSNGANLDFFYDGDTVTFNDTGLNTPAVNVQNDVIATAVTVNATQDYEWSGVGSIRSSGALNKSGTGTLTLAVSNTYVGPAVISAGTVQVGNGSTTGTLSASVVTNNSALVFNRSDTVGMASEITGSGSISQVSAGGVQLVGSNSYAGVTLVTNGFVYPRNPLAFGSPAVGTVATNGGQIYIDQNIDIAAEPLTLGGAALRKGGGGVSSLGGVITLVANSTINIDGGATLNLTNTAGVSGSGTSLELTGPGNGSTAGPATLGAGGINKTGSGTWTMGANNNFTGLTTLSAGTLRIVDNTVGNPASFTANQVTLGGGTLTATTNIAFAGGNVGFAVTGTTGGFGVESGATLVISNDISGTGTLAKSGPGTLVLAGPNTFSGTLRIDSTSVTANDGALRITTSNAIAAVLSPIYSGNNNGGISTLQLDGTAGPIGIVQGFLVNCRNSGVAWINNLAGNNTLLGGVQVEVGGGTLPFQSDAGLLTVANNIQYVGASLNGRSYQFGGAGNTLVSGVVLNGDNGAPVSVSKVGTGTLTLAAANTYLGVTTINNGLLSLTGSISSTGAVSVVGGTLGGTGTITDNVSVGAAGTVAPGVSGIGTLTINGNLALAGGLAIDVNTSASPTNDFITVSGTLVNSGTGLVTVSNLGPALVAGNSFKLFNGPVTGGGSLVITNGLGAGLAWTNLLAVDGSIAVVTAVTGPATNPTNITSSVTGGTTLNLSWPADHLGWVLQTQTNSRSVGLKPATNFWFDVPGSSTITNTSIPLDKTQPTIFFRLRSP